MHGGNDVWELAYAPDGATIATRSSDGTSRLVNANTGAVVQDRRPFQTGAGDAPLNVIGVTFGPDR